MIRYLVTFLTALLLIVTQASAVVPPPAPGAVSVLGGTTPLAVTNTSARALLGQPVANFPAVQVRNTGSVTAYVASGNSSVTATTGSIPILPGDAVTLWVSIATSNYVAAITTLGTTSLTIYQWNGNPSISFGANANATLGAVNQGTSPWIGADTTIPAATTYQGTMSLVAATSTPLTTANVVMNPGGGPLPGTFLQLTVLNTGSNPVVVCWFGGTCSDTAGGEILAAGAKDTVNMNNFVTPPTLFSDSGTTLSFRN